MPRSVRPGAVCTVPWCVKNAVGRYCNAHWSTHHKYGSATPPNVAHSGKASWHRIRLIAKTCTHCGVLKMAEEFSSNGKGISWCKPCTSRQANRYRTGENRDPVKAKAAADRFRNAVQTKTLKTADNWGSQWTPEQERVAMDPNLTMTEKAIKLGRTYKAIDSRIHIIKKRTEG